MLSAVPQIDRGAFAGHETFPLRYTWLPKAVANVARDPYVFLKEDAMVTLGVGKNMVRAIRHWGLACGMLEEDNEVSNNRGRALRVSDLGNRLFGEGGWDPYLEDPATLWVIHYELASSPERATTWYWAFNHLPQSEFTKAELSTWLHRLVQERGWSRVSPASLRRDIDVFLRTYVAARASRTVPLEDTLDSPLVELGLIREFDGKGGYLLQRGEHTSLPAPVFAYGLLRALNKRPLSARAVPIQSVAFAPGSPGRVFALLEDALMDRLERIEATTDGAVVFHDTAGLRQLLVNKAVDPTTLLRQHYGRRARRAS